MIRVCRLLALCMVTFASILAEVRAEGQTALISREFDLWPSASAVGGAAAASRDPLVALWGNPAGLAGAPGQVGATHSEWIADTRMEQLGVVLGGSHRLRMGISVQLLTTDDIPFRPATGGVPIPYVDPLGTIEARDYSLGISGGYDLRERFAVGMTVRYLAQKVHTDDAGTVAADFGGLWSISPQFRFGLAVSNVGPDLDWGSGASVPLPRSVRAGVAVMVARELSLSADTWIIRDRSVRGMLGAEWQVMPALSVRSGYMAGGDAVNFAAGFGIHWRGIGFDYAVVPMAEDLGTTHRVALRLVPSRTR